MHTAYIGIDNISGGTTPVPKRVRIFNEWRRRRAVCVFFFVFFFTRTHSNLCAVSTFLLLLVYVFFLHYRFVLINMRAPIKYLIWIVEIGCLERAAILSSLIRSRCAFVCFDFFLLPSSRFCVCVLCTHVDCAPQFIHWWEEYYTYTGSGRTRTSGGKYMRMSQRKTFLLSSFSADCESGREMAIICAIVHMCASQWFYSHRITWRDGGRCVVVVGRRKKKSLLAERASGTRAAQASAHHTQRF